MVSAAPQWRCASCAFWGDAEPDWQFDKLSVARCTKIRMRDDIAQEACPDPEERWSEAGEAKIEAAMTAAKAIAVDGSDYYAAVRCFADFGCVLWEQRQ